MLPNAAAAGEVDSGIWSSERIRIEVSYKVAITDFLVSNTSLQDHVS